MKHFPLVEAREKCFVKTKKALQSALTEDQLIIQASDMLGELQKVTNVLAKRLREWSGGWLPELDKKTADHEHFITLLANESDPLSKIGVKESVGTPINKEDQAMIIETAKAVYELSKKKQEITNYMQKKLEQLMPSTLAICGTNMSAELLAHAGSLQKLAGFPGGTIQLLGAETALFRHLKNKKNRSPKHGIIFNHQLLQRAKRQDRGKVARALADKIIIAVRVDYFKGEPCGERLRKELEERFA